MQKIKHGYSSARSVIARNDHAIVHVAPKRLAIKDRVLDADSALCRRTSNGSRRTWAKATPEAENEAREEPSHDDVKA